MQRYLGSCSPGQVQMLQNICDMVLLELQTFNMETAAEAVLLSFSAGLGEGMVPPVSQEVERALVPPETKYIHPPVAIID